MQVGHSIRLDDSYLICGHIFGNNWTAAKDWAVGQVVMSATFIALDVTKFAAGYPLGQALCGCSYIFPAMYVNIVCRVIIDTIALNFKIEQRSYLLWHRPTSWILTGMILAPLIGRNITVGFLAITPLILISAITSIVWQKFTSMTKI